MSQNGSRIQMDNGTLRVPNDPIIPFIEGDGIGPDIWKASVRVLMQQLRKLTRAKERYIGLKSMQGKKPSINSIIGFRMKPLTNAENIWSPSRVHLPLQ